MIVVSIMGVISSVVFYNYGDFNDSLALSSAANEVAIAIRQSQVYGINVKESTTGSTQFNYSFGIYFDRSRTNYRVFVDSVIPANNKYDAGESVELFNLRNGVRINNVCDTTGGPANCNRPNNLVQGINVIFTRPNPDAKIYFADNSGNNILGPISAAKVRLRSAKGTDKYVIIESTGQVTIQ